MTNAFIWGLGPVELAIILVIVLVIVGGKRLPQLGRQLGGGVREFKDTVTSKADKHFDDDSPAGDQPALGRATDQDDAPLDGEVMRERS
jgi:sec-independent protein translocase protein TatA